MSAGDPELYRWTRVPAGQAEARRYVATAAAARQAATAAPFAVIRLDDEAVIGSTRLWDPHWLDRPADHPRHDSADPDTCEIGHTWLACRASAFTDHRRPDRAAAPRARPDRGTL